MKEHVYGESPAVSISLPSDAISEFRRTRDVIASRSAVVWGEHCSECAFPDCYSTCEFYTPRHDLHCRRFENGIESVEVRDCAELSYLTRITFRKWGKLEGTGPVSLEPLEEHRVRNRFHALADALATDLPLPRVLGTRLTHRLNERRNAVGVVPNEAVFIVESHLDQSSPVDLQLSFIPWSASIPGLFQFPLTLKPGYNRSVIPSSAIRASTPLDVPFAIRLEVIGGAPCQPIVFGLIDFATLREDLASTGGSFALNEGGTVRAKCVVWDLDNTLWTGTLAEDGVEKLTINHDAVDAVRYFDERGILNSVASKNDEASALAALKHFGLDQYILHPQIGWGPKSEAIARIAGTIGIGIDAIAFVDDEPFERAEVGAVHPEVTVITPADIAEFEKNTFFSVPITDEGRRRRLMYREEQNRKTAAATNGTDYLAFLRSSQLVLTISPVTDESMERVYELSQRTNQLNIAGTRLTREEVREFIHNTTDHQGYVLACRDNFGSYGIAGFCILNPVTATIDGFFMSCRLQRKHVENAFFRWISSRLSDAGFQKLSVIYKRTAKNTAAFQVLQEMGFTYTEKSPGQGVFTHDLQNWADAAIVHIEDKWSIEQRSAAS